MAVPPKVRLGMAAFEALTVHTTNTRSSFAGTAKLEIVRVVTIPPVAVSPLASEIGWAVIFTFAKSKKKVRIAARRQQEFVLIFICKTVFAQSARGGGN